MKNLMKIFVITICSLALATGAYSAQQEENKQQKKKQPQTVQHPPAATTAHPTGHPAGAGANPKHTSVEAYHGQQGAYHGQKVNKGHPSTESYHGQQGTYYGQKGKKGQTSVEAYHGQKGKKGQTPMGAYEGQTAKAAKGGKVTGATATTGKPFKPQHFNVAKQPNTAKAPPVKFQQGKHIEGSQNWQGEKYAVFRNYHSEWHDQGWWHSHYGNNIVWTFGAPRRGGRPHWTAHAGCDRRLPARSRTLHDINNRSADSPITRNGITEFVVIEKPPWSSFCGGFFQCIYARSFWLILCDVDPGER